MGASAAKEEEPDPGDLIEIFRGLYRHWAVYIGDGYVVHLLAPEGFLNARVKKEKLQDVVNNNKWGINNLLDGIYRPRPIRKIVEVALSWVGKDVEYSISDWNCEHFATKCRYGKAESFQVIMTQSMVPGATAVADGVMKACRFLGNPLIGTSTSNSHSAELIPVSKGPNVPTLPLRK
ncbi:phospholipase A and acyltransferase 4-like isoform X1 [Thunnus albacares]|uniref:phospholipase A and acyltransferase 4-like isoform X1 n=1 Tax=Thunnus albacares TaxID=8236 RepID=UPI001CF69896|nr:phospholipase A and acyltransferase 4-like isoform X1 [Thunnus albacares]XP_044220572.1 phospholipase A and acyltransferase 4-like isoform X1 [Thunnus albacares]XP_044220573.1 phospholipase A and acyltransferase 4-like isoform X1 [Thunnus albacares]